MTPLSPPPHPLLNRPNDTPTGCDYPPPQIIRVPQPQLPAAATDINLTSDALDVDRRQPGTCRGGAVAIGGKVRGADRSRRRLEAVTADQSGGLQGRVSRPRLRLLRLLLPFLSQLQQAFLHLRLPGEFSPSARLRADRNIANSESSLIASSTSQHLSSPSPRRERLRFGVINLSDAV